MSALNARRKGPELHVRDHDLLTGRDCRRIVEEAFLEFAPLVRKEIVDRVAAALAAERERVWWRRLWRKVAKGG